MSVRVLSLMVAHLSSSVGEEYSALLSKVNRNKNNSTLFYTSFKSLLILQNILLFCVPQLAFLSPYDTVESYDTGR